MKKFLLVLLASLMLYACEEEKKENLIFTNYNIEKAYKKCNPEKGNCTFINLNFPVAKGKETVAKKINDSIEHHIIEIVSGFNPDNNPETMEEMVDGFIANYGSYREDFPETDIPWEATVFAEITSETPKLLSIDFNSYTFTGGAHGYGSNTYMNFNPETGAVYTHKDLFTPAFKDFVEKDFRNKENIPQGENINSTGMFFENDEFHLPANIGFRNDKLILTYNPYEIAAYVEGQKTYEYNLNEVSNYLKIDFSEKE
ncbi:MULTISPECIES: DUF3298 and DUF4163 domain-containing protein [Zunongwangia]|uniref:DUF3298 and DUF4163 domain-containing protein n=1 Tax=Zunongwangia TaxID=417127 RepID=UPI000C944E64|nr:DUF3298 and DUF4163 domain-containing protein [Zunongwangia profunda]MAC64383.1 hypothetical protein [Flavobacteriaceae bacterium]MCC4228963.1 DUF3298 and DUF4163 domain-containing protein [Zunongwangia profunda]